MAPGKIKCRGKRPDGSPCPKTFTSYAGRIWHEEHRHGIKKKSEQTEIKLNLPEPDPELLPEPSPEPEPTSEPTGLIPSTTPVSSAFPTRETIQTKIAGAADQYLEGGIVWLMVKSVAATLSLIGEEDYLGQLKTVENELKFACRNALKPEYMARVPPAGQVLIYVAIAWLPLILKDIKNYIDFFKHMFKSKKKKDAIDVEPRDKDD